MCSFKHKSVRRCLHWMQAMSWWVDQDPVSCISYYPGTSPASCALFNRNDNIDKPSKTVSHFRSFSSFQGLQVTCDGIRLPIGANRAHFKSLKPVILPKNPRISGFLKKRHLNSWFLALNSPWVRSRTTFFANRGLNRTWFHPLLSHPRVSPSDHQKRYPAFQIFFKLSGTPGHLRRDPPSNRC